MATNYNDSLSAAKQIVDRVGKHIVLGVPLGIGKPIGLLNSLYQLASDDASINLTIITALTLSRPLIHNELEKRFIEPILERLLKDYEDPLYEKARVLQQLPHNIKVIEFFLTTAKYLHNSQVQQNYISTSYSNVIDDIKNLSVNVIGQQVAQSKNNPDLYSVSSNSDVFESAMNYLQSLKRKGQNIAIVAEVNQNLPFMLGDAAVFQSKIFTEIIDTKHYRTLFPLPRDEITVKDQLIGLYTSCLIKDDSSLQVGIGKLGNSLANALILRHKNNDVYRDLMHQLAVQDKFGDVIDQIGSFNIFEKGIYAPTEMLSDEYMQLYKHEILKKRVYDHVGLQRLLNLQKITETITPATLDILIENKIINPKLTNANFNFLQKFGILNPDISYKSGNLILSSNQSIPADLTDPSAKQMIIKHCLGKKLKLGRIAHAGFFLGSVDFYQALNDLSPDELSLFNMTTIARTNSFHWSYKLAQLQHQQARFVNSAMMVTLGGVIISDGLKNMQEVSGVGGQFDFVYMAHRIAHARLIMNCPSTRTTNQGVESNIVWEYSNFTIPRFLRDIVVTEYGIADCRSKTDCEIIKAMLNITDSRFQPDLLNTAKKHGKLAKDYEIPRKFQENLPDKVNPIIKEFQRKGYCQPFPFGSDLSKDEIVLSHALLFLKKATKIKLIFLILNSFLYAKTNDKFDKYLKRMNLDFPKSLKEYIYKKLLILALKKTSSK